MMKLIFILLPLLCLASCSNSEEDNFGEATTIEAETVYSFDDVMEGEIVKVTFEVKNTGKIPLTIVDVKPACGCTVAEFTKEPVLPGETAFIKSELNTSGMFGDVTKSITMMANTYPTRTPFMIKGNVLRN